MLKNSEESFLKRPPLMLLKAACLLSICNMICSCALPYSGKVMDKQTGEPIEGAIVVRQWDRITATPAGAVTTFVGIKEELSDENGKFAVSGLVHSPSIPVLQNVEEQDTVVYKPGYKFLSLSDNRSVIHLERVPTSPQTRRAEWDKASGNFIIDVYKTCLLKEAISKEEEFIKSAEPIKKRTPSKKLPPKPLVITPSKKSGAGLAEDIPVATRTEQGPQSTNHSKNSPKDFVTANIKMLADPSSHEDSRARAAASLGDKKDPRVVRALIEALNDRSDRVRNYAVRSLGRQQDPQAVPYLIELLRDNSRDVRISVIEILGNLKDPRAIPSLLRLVQEEDSYMRNVLWEALGNLHVDQFHDPCVKIAMDLLMKELGDRKRYDLAGRTLEKFGEQAVLPLSDALNSDDLNLRIEAAHVLGRIRNPKAIDPLINLLDSNNSASWAAADALKNFDNPKVIKALISALKRNDDYFRGYVLISLIHKGSTAVDYLLQALDTSEETVRPWIVNILRSINDPRVEATFISLLTDRNLEVRKNAAIGLIRHPTEKAVKPLISALKDQDSEMRTKVAEALVAIGSQATDQLILAVTASDPYVRWRAAWCLGRIGDAKSLTALLAILDDRVGEVRWSAIDALEQIGDRRAVSKLLQLCHDSDSGISAKAGSALVAITGNTDCLNTK